MTVATLSPQAERTQLQKELATLQSKLATLNTTHMRGLAAQARGRTPEHNLDEMEAEIAELERRETAIVAALDVVGGEVRQAEQQAAQATRQAQRQAILDTLAEYEATCALLDHDLLNLALWRRLDALGKQGNQRLRSYSRSDLAMPFKPNLISDLELFFRMRAKELMMGVTNPRAPLDSVKTVSVWLGMKHLRASVEAVVSR